MPCYDCFSAKPVSGVFEILPTTPSNALRTIYSNRPGVGAHATRGALRRFCTVRWSDYTDAVTGTRLLAGCLPVYDQGTQEVRGVTCADLNMVVVRVRAQYI